MKKCFITSGPGRSSRVTDKVCSISKYTPVLACTHKHAYIAVAKMDKKEKKDFFVLKVVCARQIVQIKNLFTDTTNIRLLNNTDLIRTHFV